MKRAVVAVGAVEDSCDGSGESLDISRLIKESVVAMMNEMRYSALVIDAKLEGGSGILLAREIRHSSQSPNRMAPMVLLDCRSTSRRVSAARDGGASEYVCKPMSRKAFTQHFRKAVTDSRSFINISNNSEHE